MTIPSSLRVKFIHSWIYRSNLLLFSVGGKKEEGKKEWKEKKSGEETGSSSSIRPRRSIRKEKKRRKRANYRRKTNICRKSCGRSRYSIEFFSFPKILNMTIARWKPCANGMYPSLKEKKVFDNEAFSIISVSRNTRLNDQVPVYRPLLNSSGALLHFLSENLPAGNKRIPGRSARWNLENEARCSIVRRFDSQRSLWRGYKAENKHPRRWK